MRKEVNCDCINYIVLAEDPLGAIVICQEYKDYNKALAAYDLVYAPKVVLYKQECKTSVLEQCSRIRRRLW